MKDIFTKAAPANGAFRDGMKRFMRALAAPALPDSVTGDEPANPVLTLRTRALLRTIQG